MKVILNDHVEHLGERGQKVDVKPGYARNYLLPKGLAYADTPGNLRRFEQEQKHWEDMDLSRRTAAEAVAESLTGTELVFERRAGEKDVLFGSVNITDIARRLADMGFEIDKRRVLLADTIKALGSFETEILIHRDIRVAIPIHVVRPGEQPVTTDEEPPADEPGAEPAQESAQEPAE
jgi:large subunit ribosomal protein L9